MKRIDWNTLDENARAQALARPVRARGDELRAGVARIIDQVRADGDHALRLLTRRYEGCGLEALEVSAAEREQAERAVDPALKAAIADAAARIEAFHRATAPPPVRVETAPGVVCERVLRPIARVGL